MKERIKKKTTKMVVFLKKLENVYFDNSTILALKVSVE